MRSPLSIVVVNIIIYCTLATKDITVDRKYDFSYACEIRYRIGDWKTCACSLSIFI